MSRTDFVAVLDGNYADFLALGLRALRAFHPEARLFLYDVSERPSDSLRALGGERGVVYSHWAGERWLRLPWVEGLEFAYFHRGWGAVDELRYRLRRMRTRLTGRSKSTWITDKREFTRAKTRVIHIWAQKPLCIRDALARSGRQVIFLDADAVVWRNLDPVFDKRFDVALTLRRLEDVRVGRDHGIASEESAPYRAVNAGVIFVRNTPAAFGFIDSWIAQIRATRHFMVEQTALSALALAADPDAFAAYERPLTVATGAGPAILLLLPCEPYNNTYFGDDLEFDREGSAVVHFKGYLKQPEYLERLRSIVDERLAAAAGRAATP